MNYKAVYRTAAATPGILISLLISKVSQGMYEESIAQMSGHRALVI